MESAQADMLTGRMLDRRYHVVSRIAHGGMATVYLATDTRLDRQVAIKVMHAELARDAEFVERFIGEAKSVARLSQQNIVAVFDQGSDGDFLFLAMEYVPGRTLRALLRERRWLPWPDALALMDPILCALAAAHQAGIVHRDVKPENVLITPDGRVKVVDFGLARASAAMGNTRAGTIIGSVGYIAPEQVTGAPTDARTDVYSAGVMLFEMLTGRQPFTGETPLAVAYAHVNSDVPPVGALVGGIPPTLDQLVGAATSRDPQWRPGNAEVFLRAVRSLRGVPEQAEAPGSGWAAPAGVAVTSGDLRALGDAFDGAGRPGYGAAEYGAPEYSATGRYEAGGAPFNGTSIIRPGHDGYGGYGQTVAGSQGADGPDDREPFLQRWLFSRRLAYVAVAAVALIGLGGGGWWLTSGRYTNVPSVAGLTAATARQELMRAGFKVTTRSREIDNNVARNDVISTSPSGRALPGSTVALTVSLGPRMITVPPVAGKPSAEAAAAVLRGVGLTVSPTSKGVGVTGTVVMGAVVGTVPAAGTSWPQNKPVTIEVVAGLALPNLVGQDINAIQQWAGQNHINLQQTQVKSNKPQGIIVAQSIPMGTPVAPGGTVAVSVSQGPPEVQIPNDLIGQPFQQVQQELQSLGFQVNGEQQFNFGQKVTQIDPSGQAPQGSTITVIYGGFGGLGF
jgi:beta-lactam-binding protein with PASTA domain/tRNA A-37 threonylcarbamoyl transferase component Bud32